MITLFPATKSFACFVRQKKPNKCEPKLNCFKSKFDFPQLLFFQSWWFPFFLSQVVKVLLNLLKQITEKSETPFWTPLGRSNICVYVSPAVQAFYPPTTTLLNFHTYLTCYVPDDTPVLCDCKSCSANCFSLRKFEWQSYSCSATLKKRWTFCKTWDLTGISSWSFWTRFMPNFKDFYKCALEPFVGLNIVFMTFSYDAFTFDCNCFRYQTDFRPWLPNP